MFIKRIIDISVPLYDGMPIYPGDPPFRRAPFLSRAKGDLAEVANLSLGSHAGTHVDVPAHFIAGGADLSSAGLEPFIGRCCVVDARGLRCIDEDFVDRQVPPQPSRILFRTDNSERRDPDTFFRDYVYVDERAATALAARRLLLVGIDYLSIERFGAAGAPAHTALLGAGVIVLEGANLAGVDAGEYILAAVPLKIAGGDGSPVRAILLEVSDGKTAP